MIFIVFLAPFFGLMSLYVAEVSIYLADDEAALEAAFGSWPLLKRHAPQAHHCA